MLKKLASGEYSLKVCFWLFGGLGVLLFNIITAITHSGALKAICYYSTVCGMNIVLFVLSNFALLMTGRGHLLYALAPHFIASACFICYVLILIRGTWKSADKYEGSKFWAFSAKWLLVCWALFSLKLIF
ncbi:MAG: hypothetical protein IKO06_04965 [Alphaproteobacteria bacterium]|nr:hypothetical protein [Alphaproteobacteria bacterium]